MLSHKSFSQTVTLSSNQAKSAIKDLIEADYCKEENKNLTEQNNILSSQVEKKSDEVNNLEKQVAKIESIVLIKDNTINEKDKIISATEKKLNRKENVSLIYKIGTGVAVVLAIILSVK